MNFLKKSLSTILCCALTVNTLGLSSIIANATESDSKDYVYDGYKINYDVTNSWGNTEIVSVTLSNTGDSTIENWMLYFDPNGQVHDTVNVQEAQTSDGITYFRNSGYNANVNPNSSVSFSYMIDDCEAMPDDFTLCQTRANKESGYQVSLQVNQTWGDSFNGNIIIQNDTDKSIEAWELTVDTNFTITEITNSWAATVTELEPYKYMLKGTYTSVIPAGGSVSLGFNGVKDGDPVISDYSLTEVIVDESVINSINNNDNKNDKLYSNCIEWSELPDSDGDGLPDAYPGGDVNQYCNNGFSCASNNSEDEIYVNDNSNLSYPNAGEIMWVNGSAVSNDIEMLLWRYETGDAQRFTPNYNESLSPAIRQVIGYKYTNTYDGVINQPYSLDQRYIFINNKGYVPINADIKTFDSGEGYCLQYFLEQIGNTTGITIYGLSEDSQNYAGNVCVPSAIEGIPVIKISDGAFMNSAISSITLPDSIVTIGQRAFYECSNLQAITIPNNVEVIRPYTFFGCTALNTITSPDSLKYVAINACEGCAITSFYIPATTEYIYENAFNNCVYIQSYSVNQGNVNYSSDSGVLFHKYKDSDNNVKIELLKYPTNKPDTNYVIPNTTNKIASDAFLYNKNLTEIIIPNSVEFIGWGAFSETNLVTATIPSSVKEVQYYIFYHCKQLQSVTILSSNPLNFADDLFFYRNSNEYSPLIVYVPADSVDEFKQRFVDYVAKGYDVCVINDEGV